MINNSEIYVTSNGWKVYPEDKIIDTSFVNFMEEGSEYLVFLSESLGFEKDKTEVFRLQTNLYIAPVFSYKTHKNSICPVSGESTYVPYQKISNNEFFSVDTEGMDAYLELKSFLIEKFCS